MKYLTLDFFQDFKCIGSTCPDTCCAGWSILVDDDSVQRYQTVSGTYGQKLRDSLVIKKGQYYFDMPNRYCPHLTETNLCEIYQNLGADSMCYSCKIYPRTSSVYGDISFILLSASCPEVARILLTHTTPLEFCFGEDSSMAEPTLTDIDWGLFNTMISALTTSVDLLQNRTISLTERLHLLLLFNSKLQVYLDREADTTSLFHTFSSPENYALLLQNLHSISRNHKAKIKALLEFYYNIPKFGSFGHLGLFKNDVLYLIDRINDNTDNHPLDLVFSKICSGESDLRYEQYCVYFLFRHYMQACEDRSPEKKIVELFHILNLWQCIVVSRIIDGSSKDVAICQTEVLAQISRVFEHASTNLDTLYSVYENVQMSHMDFCLLL